MFRLKTLVTTLYEFLIELTLCISSRGDKAFPGAHNMDHGGDGKVPEAGIDRMVEDLEKQLVYLFYFRVP